MPALKYGQLITFSILVHSTIINHTYTWCSVLQPTGPKDHGLFNPDLYECNVQTLFLSALHRLEPVITSPRKAPICSRKIITLLLNDLWTWSISKVILTSHVLISLLGRHNPIHIACTSYFKLSDKPRCRSALQAAYHTLYRQANFPLSFRYSACLNLSLLLCITSECLVCVAWWLTTRAALSRGCVRTELQVHAEVSCLSAWVTYAGTHHMCRS